MPLKDITVKNPDGSVDKGKTEAAIRTAVGSAVYERRTTIKAAEVNEQLEDGITFEWDGQTYQVPNGCYVLWGPDGPSMEAAAKFDDCWVEVQP